MFLYALLLLVISDAFVSIRVISYTIGSSRDINKAVIAEGKHSLVISINISYYFILLSLYKVISLLSLYMIMPLPKEGMLHRNTTFA